MVSSLPNTNHRRNYNRGEEIILIYKGKSNLVKITTVSKGGTAEAEEI